MVVNGNEKKESLGEIGRRKPDKHRERHDGYRFWSILSLKAHCQPSAQLPIGQDANKPQPPKIFGEQAQKPPDLRSEGPRDRRPGTTFIGQLEDPLLATELVRSSRPMPFSAAKMGRFVDFS